MSTTTQVNPQITDAITQTNPSPRGDAPAIALGNLYQATAHALGVAAENAVSSQQQQSILMQAATTQAVAQLLALDTASTGVATQDPLRVVEPKGTMDTAALDSLSQIGRQIEAANKHALEEAGPWCHAARELMDTVAHALHQFMKVSLETNMGVMKQAAIAAVVIHMLKAPDQVEQYQKMLAMIEKL